MPTVARHREAFTCCSIIGGNDVGMVTNSDAHPEQIRVGSVLSAQRARFSQFTRASPSSACVAAKIGGQATFTGVGFWDFIHNQRGRARNGFELHPVLAVERL